MKKNKLMWVSFIPAIAYWYLEENYSIQIALTVGLCLAVAELIFERIVYKSVHSISKFNFYLIFILGIISLVFQNGIMFKLQPAMTGFFMGIYILFKSMKNESIMMDMMEGQVIEPKLKENLPFIERNLGYFMFSYGLFMIYPAIYLSTSQWLFFKTGGFYIASVIFLIVNVVWLKKRRI